jgi:N-acetylglucosamine kinase-like BadF-type ATPase
MTTNMGWATPPPRFLGVDGGGTKTLAVVVDADGVEHGRGHAGASNYRAVGLPQAIANLRDAVERAAAAAGCALPLTAAWLGVAGVDHPDDSSVLLGHLGTLARNVQLTNDAELMLSGLDRCVGVALIAGTGSIALGRSAAGASARAGGWGHLLGDEGSGYDLGRHALQAAARAADGRGKPTALLGLILGAWQLSAPADLIPRVHAEHDTAGIARLAPLVLRAACDGDSVARAIVWRAAAELALTATTVGDALGFQDALPLALGGGLLLHDEAFRAEVLRRVARRRPLGSVAVVTQQALSAARALAATWPDAARATPAAVETP